MRFFLISISFSFIFSSCSDLKRTERIERILTMEKSLDSIGKIMNLSKIDSLADMQIAAQGVELRIKNNYKLDTINLDFGKKMDEYKRMRRAIPKLKSNWDKVKKGIVEMRKSLKNLKTDIENNSGKREKYDEYLKFEQNKLNQLQLLCTECLKGQMKILDTYTKLHAELNRFSLDLIKEKNTL
jgi:chromosome segregation ATPase